jgi:isoleucyl-tRNA synthetase
MGMGGGLIGGLILGSLLRNNGNLFGNDGAGAAAASALTRNPPEQNQANMDLMAGIGAVDKAVAVSTAAMEASQATQTIGITSQLNNVTSSLANRVDGVKDTVNAGVMVLAQQLNTINTNLMATANETQKVVTNDGDKTRALITAQYEAALNRQLSDANAAVIALQAKLDNQAATRGVEVTTTNNINQMQQQTQQQQQYGQLYHAIWGLAQSIRSNNEAINVGSGTLTASPTNTNTNIR